MPLKDAVAACYRSQFLNSALPGGVVGDVHRGIHQGRSAGDLGRGLRSVAWERTSGQSVQIVVTAVVVMIAVFPGSRWAVGVGALVVVGGVVVLLARMGGRAPRAHGGAWQRASRLGTLVTADLREAVLASRVWPGIVLTSVLALAGYVAMFAVALRSTGMRLPAGTLLPLALVVLLAAAIPLSIAGWGPREGGAAWAFGAAGLTAAQGVTVAVAYGVLVVVSTLPGAVLLLRDRVDGGQRHPDRREAARRGPFESPASSEATR